RVGQLGDEQAHEARALTPQPAGPVVAEDVERGEDRLARRLRDAGPTVEHSAHRRLAHARVRGDVSQACHVPHSYRARSPSRRRPRRVRVGVHTWTATAGPGAARVTVSRVIWGERPYAVWPAAIPPSRRRSRTTGSWAARARWT